MTVLNSDLLARIAKRLDVRSHEQGRNGGPLKSSPLSNKSTSVPDDNSKK